MSPTKYIVSRFENRNGVISWRVSGILYGIRIRKNFRSREEAAVEKAVLEIKALQSTSGLYTVATTLTQERVREAEALFHRMEGKSRPLSFYVDYALANYREADQQKPLDQGIAEYIASKEHEFAQDQLSLPQLRRIRIDLKRLLRHFPNKLVSDLTVPSLITLLESGHAGMKTHNNRRGIISTFLKFAFQRGWIAENPIFKVPHYRIRRKRGVAATLTAAQARALMEYFETFQGGRWVPCFALCLFAGIRPSVPHGEISRLKPADVNLATGIINISADVSKIREPRKINIPPNLAAWLRAFLLWRTAELSPGSSATYAPSGRVALASTRNNPTPSAMPSRTSSSCVAGIAS